MEKRDLRQPDIIAKENPAKAKFSTLKKWRRIKAALEAVDGRAEVRCGFCFLQFDRCFEYQIACDECGLYHSGACGYRLRNGRKVTKETDIKRFLAAMQEAIKWAFEIEKKINEEIDMDMASANIVLEGKKQDAREMLQEMRRARGEE